MTIEINCPTVLSFTGLLEAYHLLYDSSDLGQKEVIRSFYMNSLPP